MKYFYPALLIILLAFTYCEDGINEAEYKPFNLADTLTIHYNQVIYSSEENISLKFDELLSDGRCPIDVICVWEGDAEVKFKIIKS